VYEDKTVQEHTAQKRGDRGYRVAVFVGDEVGSQPNFASVKLPMLHHTVMALVAHGQNLQVNPPGFDVAGEERPHEVVVITGE
jgi:hypothetical protein